MPVYLREIATAVPETSYEQTFLRDQMKEYIADDRRVKHLIHRIYNRSGIDKRHSVVEDFSDTSERSLFFNGHNNHKSPSTGTRNSLYIQYGKPLLYRVGKKLLEQNPAISRKDITHVITVSCTGFFAPGPAYEVVQELGLSRSTRRYNLGFMGCYAALPALQMAKTICEAGPDSTVMVICLELCSLHFQFGTNYDDLIAASVFADGAAGVLVSGKQPHGSDKALRLDDFATSYTEEGTGDMAWTVGDHGFNMVLSSYVPQLIESNLESAISPIGAKYPEDLTSIPIWAVHPGGRSILDKISNSLNLSEDQLAGSRKILRNYGNMSSATILFVLKQITENPSLSNGQRILGIAFGPGLTIESGLITYKEGNP